MSGDIGEAPTEPTDGWSDFLLAPGLDRILDSLCNRRRRLLLLLLNERGVINRDAVLFRGEGDTSPTELELLHNHLPKLEEAGYIEWNRETGDISKGHRFDEIEPVLELIENHADELPPDWP